LFPTSWPPDFLVVLFNKKNKQGFEMKKTFLMAAMVAMLPCASHALIAANDANLGQTCFNDDSGYRLIKCTSNLAASGKGVFANFHEKYCQSSYELTNKVEDNQNHFINNLHCVANSNSGSTYSKEIYVCTSEADYIANVCQEMQKALFQEHRYNSPTDFDWIDAGDGRDYHETYSCNTGTTNGFEHKLNCTGGIKEYACWRGYYPKSGSGASLVCEHCPDGGTSGWYTATSISSCYLENGSSFSDESGSGKIEGGTCYWKN